VLKVGDLYQNRSYDSLRVMRKGGPRLCAGINPQTAARVRAYLDAAGHGTDIDGPAHSHSMRAVFITTASTRSEHDNAV
jgi:hypothetical protein